MNLNQNTFLRYTTLSKKKMISYISFMIIKYLWFSQMFKDLDIIKEYLIQRFSDVIPGDCKNANCCPHLNKYHPSSVFEPRAVMILNSYTYCLLSLFPRTINEECWDHILNSCPCVTSSNPNQEFQIGCCERDLEEKIKID